MKFAVISDLHIDINPWDWSILSQTQQETDTVIVAGDISNDTDQTCRWIGQLRERFQNVIWIAGNHDFYNIGFHKTKLAPSTEYRNKWPTPYTVAEIYDHYSRWSNDHGIHFLSRNTVIFNDVVFAGATGWHDFRAGEPFTQEQQIDHWYRYLNDSRHVKWNQGPVDHKYVLEAAAEDTKFLHDIVANNHNKIVIITHHLPRREFAVAKPHDMVWTKLNGSFVNTAFESVRNNNIRYWIYGHTHFRSMKLIDETTFVCNPRGYPHENQHWEPIILEI